jgi:hypothetical protein
MAVLATAIRAAAPMAYRCEPNMAGTSGAMPARARTDQDEPSEIFRDFTGAHD